MSFCSQEFKILGKSVQPMERSATTALLIVPEQATLRVNVPSFGHLRLTEVLWMLYSFVGFASSETILIMNHESQEDL